MLRWILAAFMAGGLQVGTAVIALAEPAGNPATGDPSFEQILDGIRQSQAAIRDLSVTVEYEKHENPALYDPARRGEELLVKQIAMKCIAEPAGRVWYESEGDQFNIGEGGQRTKFRQRAVAAFDGETSRAMRGTPDRLTSGDIDSYISWYGYDPREFLGKFLSKPIPEFFAERAGRVVGAETWEVRPVTVIETEPVDNNGLWKYAFWVDVDRNYLVVRAIGYHQRPEDADYYVYTEREAKEHAEVAPGIWLPAEGLQRSYLTPGDEVEVAWSHAGRFTDWQVNIDVPDERYVLEFPADLIVIDRRPGAPPQEVQVQRQLDAQAAAAQAAAIAERVARSPYDESADALEQIAAGVKKAQARDARVLLVFGGNWCGWCVKLHKLFEENEEISSLLQAEYVPVWIDTAQLEKHAALGEQYAELSQHGVPFLAVLDAEDTRLTTQNTGDLEQGPNHDPAKVLEFLNAWRLPAKDAEESLAAALAQAKAENKTVLVSLGAPWCGWCHVWQGFLNDHADSLDAHYVRLKIDMDRMSKAEAVALKLRGEMSGGIPWFAVLDAEGRPSMTSDGPDGNIGYPVREPEIAHFLQLLAETAPNMSAEERAAIEAALVEAAKKYQ